MGRRNRNKDQDKEIEDLKKENLSLKKKLGKLRKDMSITQDALISNQEYATYEIELEKKNKIKKCSACGGEIKRFKILDKLFDICQRCKNRSKVKEEN